MHWKRRALILSKYLERTAKTIATITALVAALAFLFPWIGGWVKWITAERFGAKGFAYYEVVTNLAIAKQRYQECRAYNKSHSKEPQKLCDFPSENFQLSTTYASSWYAPRSTNRTFEGINARDVLQAGSAAHLRSAESSTSPVAYVLKDKDCVIVLSNNKTPVASAGYSAGWLYVATTACGLFQ